MVLTKEVHLSSSVSTFQHLLLCRIIYNIENSTGQKVFKLINPNLSSEMLKDQQGSQSSGPTGGYLSRSLLKCNFWSVLIYYIGLAYLKTTYQHVCISFTTELDGNLYLLCCTLPVSSPLEKQSKLD